MNAARVESTTSGRIVTACVGALAGLALWAFIDVLEKVITDQRLYTFLFALVTGYFAVLLALIGPAGLKRAMFGAALPAVPAALLLGFASLRYEDIGQFIQSSHALLSFLTILIIGTPFVAAFLKDRQAWRHYPELFDISWTITVRYTAAWLFTGLFWAVLTLSGALLEIVGITVIDVLLDIEPVPYVLTGLVLGLGMSVIHELRDYVSPFLILRLLRLLLPVVVVVVALFIVALPFRGLSGLFGNFSAAATLMAMAAAGITLISTALDKTDADAVSTPGMRGATQALALLLPVMGGLSLYAVYLRVAQYGWTPDRLAAVIAALFILIYAVLYAVSVVLRGSWMERIRRANVMMALGLVLVSGLWLTPILNAEAISANSQVQRFADGRVAAEKVAIWEMSREWGSPGKTGVVRLRALSDVPGYDVLLGRLQAAEQETSKYAFERGRVTQGHTERLQQLHSIMPVLTKGAEVLPASFDGLGQSKVKDWLAACARDAGEGQPGCVLVLAPFSEAGGDSRGFAFLLAATGRVDVERVALRTDRLLTSGNVNDEATGRKPVLNATDLRAIQASEFRIAPSSRKALWFGDVELIPNN